MGGAVGQGATVGLEEQYGGRSSRVVSRVGGAVGQGEAVGW